MAVVYKTKIEAAFAMARRQSLEMMTPWGKDSLIIFVTMDMGSSMSELLVGEVGVLVEVLLVLVFGGFMLLFVVLLLGVISFESMLLLLFEFEI